MTSIPEKRPAPDPTWTSPEGDPPPVPATVTGFALACLRLPMLSFVVFGGLALHLLLRMVERPLAGHDRPVTPFVTQGVCRLSLAILGLRPRVIGRPMRERGAVVANHVSWLDIFVLNAPQRLYFVSKAEVATWPGIGWLARATGTVFIRRDARDAKLQKEIFEDRLRRGHHLCFFPEGTSSDGVRLLPFKPTLFAAFFAEGIRHVIKIQPVSLVYLAPTGRDARFYGWYGSLGFGAHLWQVLCQTRRGAVDIVFHEPVPVDGFGNRKDLARHCETTILRAMEMRLPPGVLRR